MGTGAWPKGIKPDPTNYNVEQRRLFDAFENSDSANQLSVDTGYGMKPANIWVKKGWEEKDGYGSYDAEKSNAWIDEKRANRPTSAPPSTRRGSLVSEKNTRRAVSAPSTSRSASRREPSRMLRDTDGEWEDDDDEDDEEEEEEEEEEDDDEWEWEEERDEGFEYGSKKSDQRKSRARLRAPSVQSKDEGYWSEDDDEEEDGEEERETERDKKRFAQSRSRLRGGEWRGMPDHRSSQRSRSSTRGFIDEEDEEDDEEEEEEERGYATSRRSGRGRSRTRSGYPPPPRRTGSTNQNYSTEHSRPRSESHIPVSSTHSKSRGR